MATARPDRGSRYNRVSLANNNFNNNLPARGNFAPNNPSGRSTEFWRNKHVPGETDVARQLRLASRHFDKYGNPISQPIIAQPYKNRRPLGQQNQTSNNNNDDNDNNNDFGKEAGKEANSSVAPAVATNAAAPTAPADAPRSNSIDRGDAAKRGGAMVAVPYLKIHKNGESAKRLDTSTSRQYGNGQRKGSLPKSGVSPTTPAPPPPTEKASAQVEKTVDVSRLEQGPLTDDHNNFRDKYHHNNSGDDYNKHMTNNQSNFRRNSNVRFRNNNNTGHRNSYRGNRQNRRSDGRTYQPNHQSQEPANPQRQPEHTANEQRPTNNSDHRNWPPIRARKTESSPATAGAARSDPLQQQSPDAADAGVKLENEAVQATTGTVADNAPAEFQPNPEIGGDNGDTGRRQQQKWRKSKPPKKRRDQKWAKVPNVRKYREDDCVSDYWDDGHHIGQLAMVNVDPINFDDPDYDVKQLMDWEGGWIPAPIEWEDRAGYLERNFKERMQNFIKGLEEVSAIDTRAPFFWAPDNTEIATRSWVPSLIDNITAKSWWDKHLKSALVEIDPNAKPWWELYVKPGSEYLKTWHPPHAELDPADPQYENAKKDEGSDKAYLKVKGDLGERLRQRQNSNSYIVNNLNDNIIASNDKRLDSINDTRAQGGKKKNRNRPKVSYGITKDFQLVPQNAPKSIRLKSNIFLREALELDTSQITEIYNYHVANSIHVAEREALSEAEMRTRLLDTQANQLPFLVAVDRFARSNVNNSSSKNKMKNGDSDAQQRRPERTSDHPSMEKIVGFAFADDIHSSKSMYHFTCEFEVFVDVDYQRQRIGSCLLDKMTSLVDVGYMTRGGYAFQNPGSWPRLDPGGMRRVNVMVANVPYAMEEVALRERVEKAENMRKREKREKREKQEEADAGLSGGIAAGGDVGGGIGGDTGAVGTSFNKDKDTSKSRNKGKGKDKGSGQDVIEGGNNGDVENPAAATAATAALAAARSTWLFAWLEEFGYEKVGDLPEVGVKLDKFVNLAIFHRKTSFRLNPTTAVW